MVAQTLDRITALLSVSALVLLVVSKTAYAQPTSSQSVKAENKNFPPSIIVPPVPEKGMEDKGPISITGWFSASMYIYISV